MGLEREEELIWETLSKQSPSHTVGLERVNGLMLKVGTGTSPSHTVGLEPHNATYLALHYVAVTIPHGGLRTEVIRLIVPML